MTTRTLVGVLELNCGKTYGRQVRTSKKEGRLLYGVRHHYHGIPPLKAPYDIRNQQRVGTCSRYVKDKYVLFNYNTHANDHDHPEQLRQRPEVTIVETFGDVDDLQAFGSYRVCYSGLALSSSWTKCLQHVRTSKAAQEVVTVAADGYSLGEGLTEVFTIDPAGCKDMDDGVGIRRRSDNMYDIAIAITHVPSFLAAAGLSSDQLVSALSNTCSLYMGERVVNMLPKHFAENVCSLTSSDMKMALVMGFTWDMRGHKMSEGHIAVTPVTVTDNFVYDSPELLLDERYSQLASCVTDMSKSHRSFPACSQIINSHDVVAYLMTLMNFYVMDWLEERGLPCVYRVNRERTDIAIPSELEHLRKKVGNYAGEYCDKAGLCDMRAECEGLTVWSHITSPMRRLADLTNMITISSHIHPERYCCMLGFRDHCLGIIRIMSEQYKHSKRVSLDYGLFALVKTMADDGSLFSKTYDGVVMSEQTGDNSQAVVYIEELSRFLNCITTTSRFGHVKCRIVGLDEGHRISDKVRVVAVEN